MESSRSHRASHTAVAGAPVAGDPARDVPLCVDLDGTLLRTDTLLESAVALLRRNPLYLFLIPLWLLGGRAHLKSQIARRVTLDVSRLPYNEEVREFLTKERRRGRRLFLVTASNVEPARQIADYLGLFAGVFASDDITNLSGRWKRRLLEQQFGPRGYDYAANAMVDLHIWSGARHAIVVNASPHLIRRAQRLAPTTILAPRALSLGTLARALRLHQWAKNSLIFVPLLTSHQIGHPPAVVASLLAFVAFGLCASTGYLINDVLDLQHDRQHPTKRFRPLACGDLSLLTVLWLLPSCLTGAVLIGAQLPAGFLPTLGLYLLGTGTYSLYLKQFVLVDVLVLAALYVLRIYAGAVAIGVVTSQWLLLFSMFIFLSLALMKRFAELRVSVLEHRAVPMGRGYARSDLDHVATVGSTTGYLAVLVLALYVSGDDVTVLYRHPQLLWLACPLMLYWISRAWLLAHRGRMNEDPVVFALRDRTSYVVGLLTVLLMFLAA